MPSVLHYGHTAVRVEDEDAAKYRLLIGRILASNGREWLPINGSDAATGEPVTVCMLVAQGVPIHFIEDPSTDTSDVHERLMTVYGEGWDSPYRVASELPSPE